MTLRLRARVNVDRSARGIRMKYILFHYQNWNFSFISDPSTDTRAHCAYKKVQFSNALARAKNTVGVVLVQGGGEPRAHTEFFFKITCVEYGCGFLYERFQVRPILQ